jgi:Fibronectin type III domain
LCDIMPTIPQLSPVTEVTAADELPLSQNGTTHSVTVGTLLAGVQPAIISATGNLLGRISVGPGGPEPIAVGTGLTLNGGTIAASGADHAAFVQETSLVATDQVVLNSAGSPKLLLLSLLRGLFAAGNNVTIDAAGTISATGGSGGDATPIATLAPVSTIAASDLVAISQGGTDHAITYANLLDGLTIDLAQPASPAADADTLWVAQGSSTMLRQSFAAVWAWMAGKLPTYHLPVVELTTNTTLDGTVHNGRVLVCSQPITLTPAPINMGSGFACDVINVSGGSITFAAGITTSSGAPTLASGQAASLRVATYSAGTIVFASMPGSGGGGAPLTAPGQVTGLTATNEATNSVILSWLAAPSGGTGATYTIQYRVSGTTTWNISATGVTATTATVSGLVPSTPYDFQVTCVNAAGSGPSSTVVTTSTAATASSITSITWNMVPSGSYTHGSGSIGVNAHVAPATSQIQFGFSTSTDVLPTQWTASNLVNTDLWGQYVATPATPGTWYVWAEGMDGSHPTIYPTPFTVT